MNKQQTEELYDRVQTNWNLKTLPNNRLKELKTWHHYLQTLNHHDASKAIDARALTDTFPPKPGQIYTDVQTNLGKAPPTPQQALIQSKQLLDAVKHGTPLPNTHPLVAETTAQTGTQTDNTFLKIYEQKRRQHLTNLLHNT